MEIPPAPLCQRGVRAGSPLRKRGVRGDLLQHVNQSCHDSDSPLDFETVSSRLSTGRMPVPPGPYQGRGKPLIVSKNTLPYCRKLLPGKAGTQQLIEGAREYGVPIDPSSKEQIVLWKGRRFCFIRVNIVY